MSAPKGPRDFGDADDPDARTGDGSLADAPDPDIAGDEDEWAMDDIAWGASPEYDESDGSHSISAFVVGALAGAMALGLVWAVTVSVTDNDSGPSTAGTATSAPTTGA